MIASPNAAEIEQFRALIARCLGLQFDDSKLGFLADVLQRRLDATGCGCGEYLAQLTSDLSRPETGALAQELTVPETYFFRNTDQFRAFREMVLPQRLRARAPQKLLRVLSAGCASGEEPYSIAILAREMVADPSWQISIRAVDINPAALAKGARARFSSWSLRETPPDVQRRWFRQDGREMILDDGIRDAVKFEERNLIEDNFELWQPDVYDVVFCRNMLMYLTAQSAQAVIDRIARSLVPGGYLFLGHAETLRGLSPDFHLRHTHDTFYYQRKDPAESAATGKHAPSNADPYPAFIPARVAAREDTGDWVEMIGKASERIGALAKVSPEVANLAPVSKPRRDIQGALDLLLKERFEDALDLVETFSPKSNDDTDMLLLRAALLTHSGQFAAAETACHRLLELDDLNAGAHYVLALCHERAEDREAAAEHDRVAVYLDPAFAMPRLHLGLLARRAGERESARRELGQALILLRREDASRLLLFGGGFNRQALIALCESAMRDCGGQA